MKMNINKKGPVFEGGTCRCCGVTKKCRLLNVDYEFCGKKENYFDMFVDCFGLLLSHMEGEEKERLICATCVTRLRDASAFKKQVLHCEEKLLLQMQTDDESKASNVKFQIKVEVEDAADMDNDYDEPPCGQTESEQADIKMPQPIVLSKIKVNVKREPGSLVKQPVRRLIKRNDEALRAKKEMLWRLKRMRERLIAIQRRKTEKPTSLPTARSTTSTYNHWIMTRRAFHNITTLVENSYVCPFFTTFNSYNCVYCKEMFINPQELKEHTLSHDPRFYKRKVIYKKDLQIDISRIDCRLCPESIANLETFHRHITRVHNKKVFPNLENAFLKFNLNLDSFSCLECKASFQNFVDLKRHMAEHFGTCICDVCGAYFFDEGKLFAHQEIHKNINEKSFSCEECGRIYRSKRGIENHIACAHTKKPVYNCNECNEIFFSQIERSKHKAEVHGDSTKIYTCEQCDKVYDKKRSLNAHLRSKHPKSLNHECEICGEKYYMFCLLKAHMVSHTGEKNYKCERCGKRYASNGVLRAHKRRHEAKDAGL